jgi:hypothetical protein
MSRSRFRRERIVRVRTVEYRIAQLKLAQARKEVQHIESIAERIEALARENTLGEGGIDGASLAGISELSMRLAHAHRSTSGPLEQALRHFAVRQTENNQANRKAESASKFLAKTMQQKSVDADARDSAARCFRTMAEGDEE